MKFQNKKQQQLKNLTKNGLLERKGKFQNS